MVVQAATSASYGQRLLPGPFHRVKYPIYITAYSKFSITSISGCTTLSAIALFVDLYWILVSLGSSILGRYLFRARCILPIGPLRHASPIFKMLSITFRIHSIRFGAFILSHVNVPSFYYCSMSLLLFRVFNTVPECVIIPCIYYST